MTILTGGVCQFIIGSSGYVIPAAVGSVVGTAMTGVKIWLYSEPATASILTAVGSSASAGAISGAFTTKAVAGAVTGALVSSMSAAGLGSVVAGGMTAATSGLTAGPVGMLTVGTSLNETGDQATYDCWKSVVRDNSENRSDGMLLKDLLTHPNVTFITSSPGFCLPHIVVENVWKETFEIEYVISDRGLSCHACPVSNERQHCVHSVPIFRAL